MEINELLSKGTLFFKDNRFEEALSYFEQAVLLDSKNATAWNKKGLALRSLKRYDEAIECFNRSLFLDPKGSSVWTKD